MRRAEPGVWPTEAQRREEKRAQARLAGGLRQLDEARLYQLKTLTREQWRVHRDLGASRASNPWRNASESLGSRPRDQDLNRPSLSYWRTPLPTIPQAGRGPEKHRSQKPKSGSVGGSSAGLQARVREFMGGGVEGSGAPLCLPDLKAQTVTRPNAAAAAQGENEGEAEKKREKERGKPNWDGERRSPSPPPAAETLAPEGRLRTVHTLPSFSQALAEARKARYIRHRGRPLCERELSVGEIFARATKDAQTH
ncbi:coiled-coil domain-containing protein 190 [Anguilla rostrata]|uniref:coiled-coil domain-containing protein 190 n=1 Tax=Anguilla rostrata TaxID=7938 RepID=UPI0030CB47AC